MVQRKDTDHKTEELHIAMIRAVPIFKRLQLVSSLTNTTRRLACQATVKRYNSENIEKIKERFITFLYNDEKLAKDVINKILKKERSVE